MPDLRMLCLHGYHGSGEILRRQMAPLAATFPPGVELVYVDAPSLSRRDFGWWHGSFSGWERSRDWAVEVLRSGPRTAGIFGFSQGRAPARPPPAPAPTPPPPRALSSRAPAGGDARTPPPP